MNKAAYLTGHGGHSQTFDCVMALFVSPAKHGRYIGIMTPSASSSASLSERQLLVGFRSITFIGMHQFHSKFTKGKTSLNTGQVRKGRSSAKLWLS